MDVTDLQALLEDFTKIGEASAQIDTLLRTRKKVLAFPDADHLGTFFQPILALPELVKHLIGQQQRIAALEARQQDLERQLADSRQMLESRLAEAGRQVEAAARKTEALLDERAALTVTTQAMIACIRALDQAFMHLETHKFKFSIYDLLEKINAVIRPDDRASFEIEGSGLFESVRHTAARSAEPHLTVKRLLEAAQGRLPPSLADDPRHGPALKQLCEELQGLTEKNEERTRQAQKFGLRLKVVNREARAGATDPTAAQPAGSPPAGPSPTSGPDGGAPSVGIDWWEKKLDTPTPAPPPKPPASPRKGKKGS
ncbi:MAG: hypothetical protein GX442_06090 [Candidatus Riflebacteria bacterium]|nr:hypothetical protein [Candidatus Riflebacteria bacterium]